MSLISDEQHKALEQQQKEKVFSDTIIDRYSVFFPLLAVCIALGIIWFFKSKDGSEKWAFIPSVFALLVGFYIASRPARIRKNEYTGAIKYKGENDCGFGDTPKKEIDGVLIKGQIFKASNGTDVVIDKNGTVHPVGFGSKLMLNVRKSGYLHLPPDKCWE